MKPMRFRDELKDCLRFIRQPVLKRTLPHPSPISGWAADWVPAIDLKRLFAWAAMLWLINIAALGPLVLAVFELSGAKHRIDVHNLPWIQAIVWAPIVEELLFRYGLRHPIQAIWMVPMLVIVLLSGTSWWASSLLVLTVLLSFWVNVQSKGVGLRAWVVLRHYRSVFSLFFHLVAIAFAAIHLKNFIFTEIEGWMMVVLVLPQWVTGLVLGWMRVTRNIGSAMLLHGIFNAGPLTVAWLALTLTGKG